MNEIPTAEEFLQNYKNDSDHFADQDYSEGRLIKALKEFTKLHVEAALKQAGEKYEFNEKNVTDSPHFLKDVILNSYPLDKIK